MMKNESLTINEKTIELNDHESFLIVEDSESLRETVNTVLKTIQDTPVIYLNLTNTYNSLIANLKKEGIKTDNIFFIDYITSLAGGDLSSQENVLFIKDQNDLTCLGIVISQFFENIPGDKWFVLYAFTILKIYNSEDDLLRFIQSILENAEANNTKIVVLSTPIKEGNLIEKMAHFFEKVVRRVE